MEKIQLLLEAYSSNKKQYTEDKYFKFLKKIYKVAKSTGALNIGFIYYTLNNNSPKSMDLEFMKMYIDSLTPDNSTLVVMFTEYWNENMGMDLLDGLPMQFNLSIKEEEAFAALVANNDLEKVLKLLDITADRIASITSKCEEDIFYSKCLNDYERNEFKNAVAGLQFFGFGKKEIVNPFLSLDDEIYKERKTQINNILKEARKDFISMLTSGKFDPLVKKDIGHAIEDLDHYLPDNKNEVAKKDLFINLFRIDVDMSKEFSDKSSKDEDYTYETFWDSTDGMLGKNIDRFIQKYQDKAPSVNGKKLNNFWLMDSTDHDVVYAYISLGEFFPEIEDEIAKWE